MPIKVKTIGLATLTAGLLAVGIGDAFAGCTRRVYNRSPYHLVGDQDGGRPFVLRPGASTAIRLSRPGTVNLAAYCGPPKQGLGKPVLQTQLTYEAVLDTCFITFGSRFFEPELGRGFFGRQGTKPFTVNNPRQGDIVLGPFSAECPI